MIPPRTPVSLRIPLIASLLISAAGIAHAQQPVLTVETAIDLQSVHDAVIDPTGRRIAYVVSVPAWADSEERRAGSEIWVTSIDGSGERRFTPEGVRSSSPQWSPDGKTLAFLSKREEFNEHRQIYLIAIDGGEASLLTEHDTSIDAFRWSPDGRSIAFLAPDAKTEAQKEDEETGRDWIIVDEQHTYTRLWIADAETGESGAVYETDLDASRFEWTPGGEAIIFTAAAIPGPDAAMMHSRLFRIPIDGGEPMVICPTEGKLGRFAIAPDGTKLAFLGAVSFNDSSPQSLFVTSMDGGDPPRNLTGGFEGSAARLAWVDDETLLMLARQGTRTTLNLVHAQTGRRRTIIEGGPALWSFDLHASSGRFCAIGSTPEHASELLAGSLESDSLTRLTHHNPVLDTLRLPHVETIEWTSIDGLRIAGVLTYPVDYEPGRRCPLIVNPHGGPEGTDLVGWDMVPQLMAARGFLVLQPNYRGSIGRGVAFSKGDHDDMGGLEFQDVLAGIDALIARGLADRDRVGMAGWSYGGYLSALAATHHSRRFKAAMMGAGLSNWISFTGTTDIPEEMCSVHWNRPMAENFDLYWERSPLSGIANAQTPTLILHGAGDKRVPPGQAHEMYLALKNKGVPTQLVLYPRSGHGVSERAHRIDLFTRELEWFEKYLK